MEVDSISTQTRNPLAHNLNIWNMDITNAYEIIVDKLSGWLHALVRMLPNIALAAVVAVLGFYVARLLRRFAERFFHRFVHNATLSSLFASMLYLTAIGVVLFTVLSILKLDKAVTSILAGAGLLGLGLALAFQDIAANFISGVFISLRKPFRPGDIVQLENYMGKVEEINLRDTVLRTFQGQLVILPNKDVFQNPIENFSMLGKRRFDLTIGVSYGDDLEKVRRVTLDAVSDLPNLSEEDSPSLYFREFSDSSITLVVRMWIKSAEQKDYLQGGSLAIERIKKAYDENGIMIPFPIRTLDFGIKGGVRLDEVLGRDPRGAK